MNNIDLEGFTPDQLRTVAELIKRVRVGSQAALYNTLLLAADSIDESRESNNVDDFQQASMLNFDDQEHTINIELLNNLGAKVISEDF